MSKPACLKLFPQQKDHVEKLMSLIQKNQTIMDLSMLGTGKTYTSSALGMRLGAECGMCVKGIVVVCNVSVMGKWLGMKEQYGVPILDVISYAGLRSRKGKTELEHGLLRREDTHEMVRQRNGLHKVVEKVMFCTTEKMQQWVREGVLVVMDEVQNIKNKNSDQFAAAIALLACVRRQGASGKSRALLMSGSPIDKEEQALTMVTALGLMDSLSLCTYNVGTRRYDFSGMDRIKAWCAAQPKFAKRLESNTALAKAYAGGKNAKSCMKCLYVLFQKWIKKRLSAAMVGEGNGESDQLLKYNGLYKMEDQGKLAALTGVVHTLADAVKYNSQTEAVGAQDNKSMGQITTALMEIERLKRDTFARLAMEALRAEPKRKVVLCVNYLDTVRFLADELDAFSPLVMTGACSMKARQNIIDQFQKPTGEHRLLIGNLTVLSTGIDLDDKHGGWERVCFVSPMFSTITLYQLSHRFKRLDTHKTAKSRLYMVYIKGVIESNIMNALIRKGAIMKETVKEQAKAGVVFPCDYPEFEER